MARQYYGYNPVNENKQNDNSANSQPNQDKLKDPPPKYRGYNPVGQNNSSNINNNYTQQQVDNYQQSNQNYYNQNYNNSYQNNYNQQNNSNLNYSQINNYQVNHQQNFQSNINQLPIYSGPFPHLVRKSDLNNRVCMALSQGKKDYLAQGETFGFVVIFFFIAVAILLGNINIRAIDFDSWQTISLLVTLAIFVVSAFLSSQRRNIAKRNVSIDNYSLFEDRLMKVSESLAVDFKNKTSTTYYILYLEGLGMSYKTVSPAFEEGDLVIVQTVNVFGKKEIIQVIRK